MNPGFMIKLKKGDITKLKCDAIVNAANSKLAGGAGVDGAIHKAGGPAIMQECRVIIEKSGELPTGKAVSTSAGNMPAKYVIHTVGPVWKGGASGEEEMLYSAYINSLKEASKLNCTSVAFPNISTGIYGYPKQEAARIALRAITDYDEDSPLEEIIFCCFDDENYYIYKDLTGSGF